MSTKKSSTANENNRHSKLCRFFCIFCYAIVPMFFVIFYLLMTMSYEDILQSSSEAQLPLGSILNSIYHYIPRIGEFYQHTAVHFMTIQTTIGPDIIFRLLSAFISSGLIYLLTYFALKARPRLKLKDALVYLGFFILLMGFELSEVFLYRFSYANNYILAMLISVAFLLPYRLGAKTGTPLGLIGIVLVGFLFGISTEVTPIAVLIILVVIAIYIKKTKRLSFKDFYHQYRLQVFGVLGVLLGLLFFYCGAGLSARTGGGYGAVYDYVKLSDIFAAPIITIGKLVWHTWYNLRYLVFAIPLMITFILIEYVKFKRSKPHHLLFHLACFSFCVLFIAAASVIKVHDDLYPRFMMPVYLAICASLFVSLVDNVFSLGASVQRFIHISAITAAAVSVLMLVDMAYGMITYHKQISNVLAEHPISYSDGILKADAEGANVDMTPSPIFKFSQLTPYNWGPSNIYLKYGRSRSSE